MPGTCGTASSTNFPAIEQESTVIVTTGNAFTFIDPVTEAEPAQVPPKAVIV